MLASSKSESTQNLGNTIIILGLGIQVFFFSGFVIVTAVFHVRVTMNPTIKSQTTRSPWKRFLWVLYFSSMLIMVRSVFRMAEYAQGNDGSLLKKEVYVYVLDALLMLVVAVAFGVYYPSEVLQDVKLKGREIDFGASSDSFPMVGQAGRYERMG